MLIPITSNQAGQCFEMDFSESVAGFRKFNQFLRLRDGIQQVTVSKTLTKFYCPLSSLALHALSSRGSSPSDMRQRFPIRTTMATVLKATKACEFQIRMTSTNQFISSFDWDLQVSFHDSRADRHQSAPNLDYWFGWSFSVVSINWEATPSWKRAVPDI